MKQLASPSSNKSCQVSSFGDFRAGASLVTNGFMHKLSLIRAMGYKLCLFGSMPSADSFSFVMFVASFLWLQIFTWCHAWYTLISPRHCWCILHGCKISAFTLCVVLTTYSSPDGSVGAFFMTTSLNVSCAPCLQHTPPLMAPLLHPS